LRNALKHLPDPDSATVGELETFRDRFLVPYQRRHPKMPPYNFVCLVNDVIWGNCGDIQA
jgi:hypothetical protein